MIRLAFIASLALIAAPATAQGVVSPLNPPVSVDTAARNAAADAKATADAAAATAAAACQPMAIIPPVETPGGTTGSGQNCRLVNSANNRISRSAVFSYGSDGRVLCGGSTTCLWRDTAGDLSPLPAGATSYPLLYTPISRAANCTVTSTTNTGFTGMVCTQPNLAIALAGSTVLTVGLTPGQVFILSLPATQASQ